MKRKQHGQTLLESALTMLVFLFLTMGIVDFGQFLYFNQSVTDRLRVGARYGAVHDCGPDASNCAGAIKTAVYNDPAGAGSPLIANLNDKGAPGWVSAKASNHWAITPSKAVLVSDNNDFVTVTVHDYPVNLLLFPTFHRTSSVTMGLEWERCYSGCN